MKFNTPLPQPLPKECLKAAKIFKSFVDSGNNGLDGVIPRQILEHAKGFAIFTIVKAGFLFSARAGSGVVIARLEDGSWSAPSAIGSAGLGFGGQAGAEMTDFLVVLNSRSAIRSFMSAGSLTLGGNMSIALGPLGRNGEALGSLNTSGKVAAMYSYSKTRGLFGGVSIEGSVIVERQDANCLAYRSDVSAKQLLSGVIDPPDWAQPLIKTLEACVGMPGGRKWIDDSLESDGLAGPQDRNGGYIFNDGVASPGSDLPSSLRKKKSSVSSAFPPTHWGKRKNSGSYFLSNDTGEFSGDQESPSPTRDKDSLYGSHAAPVGNLIDDGSTAPSFPTHFESDFTPDMSPSATHRPKLSIRSDPAQSSPLDLNSQFDDHPSFSNSGKLDNVRTSHRRSASSTSYLNFGGKYNASAFQNPRIGSNSLAPQSHDPWDYDTVGESIDDYDDVKSISKPKPFLTPKAQTPRKLSDGMGTAIALYDFKPVEPGDLGFKKGQVITITKKTDKTDDWWTGKIGNGTEGIFPANFVEVV